MQTTRVTRSYSSCPFFVSLGSPHTLACLSSFGLLVVAAFYRELEWDELCIFHKPYCHGDVTEMCLVHGSVWAHWQGSWFLNQLSWPEEWESTNIAANVVQLKVGKGPRHDMPPTLFVHLYCV